LTGTQQGNADLALGGFLQAWDRLWVLSPATLISTLVTPCITLSNRH
jgi:hypothetical protein